MHVNIEIVLNAFRHQRMDHRPLRRHDRPGHSRVLNAFRHQRMDHPERSACRSPNWLCAQRLSASTNGSLGHVFDDGPRGFSAQRLSASTNGSRNRDHRQRSAEPVLNAFRHQRMDHQKDKVLRDLLVECSTPFGINEWITPERSIDNRRLTGAQRLSASTNGSLRGP